MRPMGGDTFQQNDQACTEPKDPHAHAYRPIAVSGISEHERPCAAAKQVRHEPHV